MTNSRPVFLIAVAIALIATTASVAVLSGSGRAAEPGPFDHYTADDYRPGQEQFIRLIGEEAFANFEHNHAPLDCTEVQWEEHALSCSELFHHRFEIGSYVLPEFRSRGRPASEFDGIWPTPTTTPQ